MSKKAIIIGSEGQDGKIMRSILLKKGYAVLGVGKGGVISDGIDWNDAVDIRNEEQVFKLVSTIKPDEVYYFAAFYQSSEEKKISNLESFKLSYEINVFALINFLEAVTQFSPKTRLFYAASSLIFGKVKAEVVNEGTPFSPNTPYGITKMDGLSICRFYRSNYGTFASSGILFNHESEYRPEKFLSRKIIQGAINIKRGLQKELILGDLGAEVDWGYAYDFVDAMHGILQASVSDDFIIATGEKHAVSDFAKEAFGCLGMDWRKYIKEDNKILTRNRSTVVGDYSKLKKTTGWSPGVSFHEMVVKITEKLEKQKI